MRRFSPPISVFHAKVRYVASTIHMKESNFVHFYNMHSLRGRKKPSRVCNDISAGGVGRFHHAVFFFQRVFETDRSHTKVVDFGSSLRTGTDVDLSNSTLGTTWYLPPEAVWEPTPPSPPPPPSPSPSPSQSPSPSLSAARPTNAGGVSGRGGSGSSGGGGGGRGGERRGGRHHLLATPALDMWAVGCILYMWVCVFWGFGRIDRSRKVENGRILSRGCHVISCIEYHIIALIWRSFPLVVWVYLVMSQMEQFLSRCTLKCPRCLSFGLSVPYNVPDA